MSGRRIALVTGANRGIGLAIAAALAAAGHRVILGCRDAAAGEAAAAELAEAGGDCRALALDAGSRASIDTALASLGEADRAIDILVNNAGILDSETLLALPDEDIDAAIAVHVTGPLHLVRSLAPGMAARGYGRIVNLSSSWGSFASGLGPGMYGVTKAALNALTVRLARDLPASIKVNAMDPGWVRSRMGGPGAPRSPELAADTAVWLATLPADGPSGGFFRDRRPIPW